MQRHCDSYAWIDGETYTSSNNTATHTLTNVAGCDGVGNTWLTINNSTSVESGNGIMKVMLGTIVYAESGVYSFISELDFLQLSQDIDGESANDRSGRSVAISSDSNIVAIGSQYNSTTNEEGTC